MRSLFRVLRAAAWKNRVEIAHGAGIILISIGAAEIYLPAGLITFGAVIAAETWLYARNVD